MTPIADFTVAVIGAGPGGLCAAIKLQQAGIRDYVVIERADDVGGSWHENSYPGLGVDIPAVAYQYSFDRKADWKRIFPKGPEVKQYHVDIARKYALYPKIRFNTNVEREEWDDATHLWKLHLTGGGVITARFVISAVGAFVRPKVDAGIPGWQSFQGKIQRPSDWDHSYDHTGKRVAMIGTGASSVQIVPAIADEVGTLEVFQRTPVWCLPKPDWEVSRLLQRILAIPGLVALGHTAVLAVFDIGVRMLIRIPVNPMKPLLKAVDKIAIRAYNRYLRLMVRDNDTADRLTPNFGPGTKRPTINTGYVLAYNKPNVSLVTEGIETITPHGIRTRDGIDHEFDMIILATGYEVFSDPETYLPGTILGRDGFDLGEFYAKEGLQAYESVSVPGLPNRWTLVGPYSWTGSGWHAFVEMTCNHAVRGISLATKRQATLIEVREDVAREYHDTIHERAALLRYYLAEQNGHVPSYYRNSQGDSTYLRPTSFFQAAWAHKHFPAENYRYERLHSLAVAADIPNESVGAVSA